MGKRGVKRKTRWRTFSIGTPPGEEDEDEGACNGYSKGEHDKEKNGYNGSSSAWLKSRHSSAGSSGSNGQSNGGSATSGYGSGGSRSGRYESGKLPSQHQSKIAFNEDEYTRITAPRLDVLFKKSYLQNKAWASMTSMSATPSTTGSQSASHSTADGSEAAEDQQLLDMTSGKYEVNYGTYYDHNNGYYYDYPMMLVAPEIPDHMGSNIMTAIPCAPLPLRPIEWVNPVFVPKLTSQQYCYIDHQMTPGPDCAALVDAQGMPLSPVEVEPPMNGIRTSLTDSASGSVSASGSITDEPLVAGTELQESGNQPGLPVETLETLETLEPPEELEPMDEMEPLEYSEMPYIETLPPQPIHVAHVIPQPMGQPYLYPGQFMFGPPVANVNGVMIQGGSMHRCNDVVPSSVAAICANRRRKKKKRKLKGPHALGKPEDEEEDYSSEDENGLSSPRISWPEAPTSLSNRPLNPECQEFRPRSTESQSRTQDCVPKASNVPMLNNLLDNEPKRLTDEREDREKPTEARAPGCENGDEPKINGKNNHEDKVATGKNHLTETLTNGDMPKQRRRSAKTPKVAASEPKPISNGELQLGSSRSTPLVPEINETTSPINADPQRLPESYESLVTKSTPTVSNGNPTGPSRRKYGPKSFKYVREPTPGPDLDSAPSSVATTPKNDESRLAEVTTMLTTMLTTTTLLEPQTPPKDVELDISQSWVNESSKTPESVSMEESETTEASVTTSTPEVTRSATMTTSTPETTRSATDEDSGFDSQTKLEPSMRPIASAVNEWLKGANSPDLFVTSASTSEEDPDEDEEGEGEEEEEKEKEKDAEEDHEPPKNLQSNPMAALSVNAGADERMATPSKFANSSEQSRGAGQNNRAPNTNTSKRSRNSKRAKRKRAKSNRVTNNKESLQSNKDNSKDKHTLAQHQAKISVEVLESELKKKADGVCEVTEKDSDVDMRIAKNSRMNVRNLEDSVISSEDKCSARIRQIQESGCKGKCIGDVQAVKTFEKGEIVVSLDGELLLVAPELRAKDKCGRSDSRTRRESSSSLGDENERSLGSIEEPDVLECWETEIVELSVTPKKVLQKELQDEDLSVVDISGGGSDRMEHVQRYYRLQDDSSDSIVTSVEGEEESSGGVALDDSLGASILTTVPNTPDQMSASTWSEKDIPVILPRGKEKDFAEKNSKLPLDEAFEVYESFYTSKPRPFGSMDSKLGKSRLFGRDREGPIPCKAVCCIIQ